METTMTLKQLATYIRKKLKMNEYVAYKVSSTQKGITIRYQIVTSDKDLKPYSDKYVQDIAQFVAQKHGLLITRNTGANDWFIITLTKHIKEEG